MTWEEIIKIEPTLLTLKKLARGNDSNKIRQLMENYVGLYAQKRELMTVEAFDIALINIFNWK